MGAPVKLDCRAENALFFRDFIDFSQLFLRWSTHCKLMRLTMKRLCECTSSARRLLGLCKLEAALRKKARNPAFTRPRINKMYS